MSISKVQCVVVGAGVIGLATVRSLALSGIECLVLEKRNAFGEETSSRNSEVIHAGIYGTKNSKKTNLCIAGRKSLIRYLSERHLPFELCGKLIVGNGPSGHATLNKILSGALENGVENIKYISSEHAAELEPNVSCSGALLSEGTGIMDSHAYMTSLLGDAEDAGALLVRQCNVLSITRHSNAGAPRFTLTTSQGDISCDMLVNSAGIDAVHLAAAITPPLARTHIPKAYYCKGTYFKYTPAATRSNPLFHRLIYPLPGQGGLGVHATIDMGGGIRFGPDTEWLTEEAQDCRVQVADCKVHDSRILDSHCFSKSVLHSNGADVYKVNQNRANSFYNVIREYCPSLEGDSLVADYSGIRPKLCGPSEGAQAVESSLRDTADFCIEGECVTV